MKTNVLQRSYQHLSDVFLSAEEVGGESRGRDVGPILAAHED